MTDSKVKTFKIDMASYSIKYLQSLCFYVLLIAVNILYTGLLIGFATGLSILPFSNSLFTYWPLWPAVLAITWSFCLSPQLAALSNLFIGLILDNITQCYLGTHVFVLIAISYLNYSYLSTVQPTFNVKINRAFMVFILFIVYQLLFWMAQRITFVSTPVKFPKLLLGPATTSTITWLFVSNIICNGYQYLTPRTSLSKLFIDWIKNSF